MRLSWMAIVLAATWPLACGDSTTNLAGDGDVGPEADAPPDGDVEPDASPDGDVEPDADALPDGDVEPDADALPDTDVEPDAPPDADAPEDGGPTGAPVGAPCATAADCLDGVVPSECLGASFGAVWPGGYCSALGCLDDGECAGGPPAAICIRAGGGLPLCLATCDAALDDCRSGYHCIDPDGSGLLTGVCLPACRTSDDCPPGETCSMGTDTMPVCRPGTGAANGEPCTTLGDCAAGSGCRSESEAGGSGGFAGGLCTQGCADDADCTNGGVCVLGCSDDNRTSGDDCDDDGVPGLDGRGVDGMCMVACDPADATACPRDGYTCRAVGENLSGPVDACAPDCGEADGGCTVAGHVCDPAGGALGGGDAWGLGRCQPPFDPDLLGGPCTLTGGCTGGTCLAELRSGFPFGYCTEECIAGPGGDPCPGTAICLAASGDAGRCTDLCTPTSPSCRDGYECRSVAGGAAWICMPGCTDNAQCEFACCDSGGSGFCDASRTRCL